MFPDEAELRRLGHSQTEPESEGQQEVSIARSSLAAAAAICYLSEMHSTYTAIVKENGGWWIGWIEEIPGVNAQERTKDELLASLKEILSEALEFNRDEARKAAAGNYAEETLTV